MASQTPFILADNVADRINLYSLGLLTPSGGAVISGREVNYIADYRRERTMFQYASAAANQGLVIDVGVGTTAAVDSLWLDRGHNLWGSTVNLQVADDPTFTVVNHTFNFAVPALGTLGGDPTAGFSVTEEGSIYTLFTLTSARRYFLLRITQAIAPLYTGIILGKRLQMLNYSSVLDEDEGERDERQENSRIKGYYGRERVYAGRKLRLQLATIGISEYDTIIRTMRRLLFERDQPAFIVTNYGIRPERGWLYQYSGTGFSAPASRVYRSHSFTMQELGPLIR